MTRVGGPLIDLAPLTAREQHRIRTDPGMRQLCRGIYIPTQDYWNLSYDERALVAIVVAQVTAPATAAVGFSAAIVHGLPTPKFPSRYGVELGGTGVTGRHRVPGITYRTLPERLDARIVPVPTEFGAVRATGPAATCLDLARWHSIEAAVMAMDHLLHKKELTHRKLRQGRQVYEGMHGVSRVRQAVALATAWSESPRESQVKVALWREGLAVPQQQVTIVNRRGTKLGRVDFCWPEIGFAVEYDGQGKYHGQFGQGLDEIVLRDMWREHALSNEGVTTYHLQNSGFEDGTGIAAIVEMHRRLTRRGLPLLPGRWTAAGPAWLSPGP